MNNIAPNLTALVGELVGARLIAHGGSLLNLAKQPRCTVQILGAEKALFRALKTKHATPKYVLIYHASLIGQAAQKLKGKFSISLAAKTALAIRCDALGDNQDNSMGLENRAKLEAQLRNLEGRELGHYAGSAKGKPRMEVYDKDRKKGAGALITAAKAYNGASDSILGQTTKTNVENQEERVAKKNTETTEEAPATGENKEKKKKKKWTDDDDTVLPDSNASAQADNEEITKKRKKEKKKAQDNETVLKNSNAVHRQKMKRSQRRKRRRNIQPRMLRQRMVMKTVMWQRRKKRKENMLKESEVPIKKEKKKKKSED